ncbi:hypothetical protein MTR_2g036975 [Medicago truncatula]|uniref:Uncharacterized protein n=1 Tax=Medicago truncatula TaxID=3880 RepID=A0A072VH13_MEDTR|nr:hypothetical protein MTR_2g036975 [Medicago truncatula]
MHNDNSIDQLGAPDTFDPTSRKMKIDSRQEERFWIRNIMEICSFLNPSCDLKSRVGPYQEVHQTISSMFVQIFA